MLVQASPYWRWSLLDYAVKKRSKPSDPWLERLYDIYKGNAVATLDEEITVDHVFNEFKRDVIMAYFFARCSTRDVQDSLELPINVIEAVAKLFFDRSKIHTKLDHIEYAREYMDKFASTEGRNLIYLGMTGGPIALKSKFCLGYEMPDIDQEYVQHRMYMTAVSFGLMVRGNALTSKEGKESLRWFQQANDMSVMYRRIQDSTNTVQDAIVAIEQRQLVHRPESAGLNRDEILH